MSCARLNTTSNQKGKLMEKWNILLRGKKGAALCERVHSFSKAQSEIAGIVSRTRGIRFCDEQSRTEIWKQTFHGFRSQWCISDVFTSQGLNEQHA
jgi:hypothetical protein